MTDTDAKAKSGMAKFVVTIFVAALMIALGYFVFLTPGESTNTTIETTP